METATIRESDFHSKDTWDYVCKVFGLDPDRTADIEVSLADSFTVED